MLLLVSRLLLLPLLVRVRSMMRESVRMCIERGDGARQHVRCASHAIGRALVVRRTAVHQLVEVAVDRGALWQLLAERQLRQLPELARAERVQLRVGQLAVEAAVDPRGDVQVERDQRQELNLQRVDLAQSHPADAAVETVVVVRIV